MKPEPDVYKPAEACRIAEVAPYVLRYWETEFPALSEGKEKGAARLYSGRDVKIISRIRELLYDEGFTVAGAKKRLDAEIAEGRFDDGLAPAPPLAEQRRTGPAPAGRKAEIPPARAPAQASLLKATSAAKESPSARAAGAVSASSSDFDRKRVIRELKEIVKLLDRR
ncbi:MAG TPA: MerR family transcriptional regulator [Thermoanaerobaculia bacterium]